MHIILVGLCLCQGVRIPICLHVVDGVLSLIGSELLTILRGKLVKNSLLRHVHAVGIALRLGKRVGVPIRLHVIDCVLSSLSGELATVFGGQLVVDPLLGHVHGVGIGVCLRKSGRILRWHIILWSRFGSSRLRLSSRRVIRTRRL